MATSVEVISVIFQCFITHMIRDVRIYASVFIIRHYSAIFCYLVLFGILQRICNRIGIVDEYHWKSKNLNLLLKNNEKKKICGCRSLRVVWSHHGLGSHRPQQIFLGGSSGWLGAEKVYLGRRVHTSFQYLQFVFGLVFANSRSQLFGTIRYSTIRQIFTVRTSLHMMMLFWNNC